MLLNNNNLDSKLKILVCCHKKCKLPTYDKNIFLPIHVGAAISDLNLEIQRDDQIYNESCDNISNKNKSYCELTAIYWAWKNIKKIYPELEYIGLNHYRRFFNFAEPYAQDWNRKSIDSITDYKLDRVKLINFLNHGIGVMSKEKIYPYSLAVDYSVAHISEDLRILGNLIKNDYSEYYKDFVKVFYCNNKLSHFNMFIWKYEDFQKYCEWLFSILFKAESLINISMYNPVQARIWGYMAERLLNVYVRKNKMSMKYLPVNIYNDTYENSLKYWLNRIRYNIAFNISKPSFKNVWNERNKEY